LADDPDFEHIMIDATIVRAHQHAAKREAQDQAIGRSRGGLSTKRVCIPNRSTKSPERKREQKKRWFRNGQKWRTRSEGRISVVKRRHGLNRCRYKGSIGMDRWVGLGVIADNLVNIGRAMERQATLTLVLSD
jgi:IS5 family transposase